MRSLAKRFESGGIRLVLQAVILGPAWHNRGRFLLSLAGIALGVALGVSVHLINHAAVKEFTLAARSLSGDADILIRGPRSGFPESLYPFVARLPEVESVVPALEIDARLPGRQEPLRVLGLDAFRALRVQPALFGNQAGKALELLATDAILLSPAAAEWLGVKGGGTIEILVGLQPVTLRVAALLPGEAYRQKLAVMDIANAQWHLQRLGTLNRIDMRLRPGVDEARFMADLQSKLPAGVLAISPATESDRAASLSRPYRINLNMLALVALFTGMFLVFSTQYLSVLRRRTQLALLRVMGVTRRGLVGLVLGEGAVLGTAGAALGVALGWLLGGFGLQTLGPDLGGGYFYGIVPSLHADPWALAGYFGLGLAAALLGSLAPALEAARSEPALAIRAGDPDRSLRRLGTPWPGVALVIAGGLASQGPAVSEIPVFGYLSIALILIGAILLMPGLMAKLAPSLPAAHIPPARLALAQFRDTPGQMAISVAAVLVSFSLLVSMAILVTSFRLSLDTWLQRLLPADLYVRTAGVGETAFLTSRDQARISQAAGVDRVDFLRSQNLLLHPERPPVILIARPVETDRPQRILPLISPPVTPLSGAAPPVWVSEAVADLYGARPGTLMMLPLGGRTLPFTVAGIWRDYARQAGAVVMDLALYRTLTGDPLANDAAIWMAPGSHPGEVAANLRAALPEAGNLEIVEPSYIRDLSLRIFDRSFAATYALEAVAILIGLFGVSANFSARALARRSEFGVLRHLGMTRGQIGRLLALEGALSAFIGAAAGLALGGVISLILIHAVNRQSFHWSIDLHMPWALLIGAAAGLIACASLTAVWSGRQAMGRDVVGAVREDW